MPKISDTKALATLRKDSRIDIIDDERNIGNSLIINLKDGWRFRAPDEHVFGEDSAVEALASMKFVHPCDCSDACKAASARVRKETEVKVSGRKPETAKAAKAKG